MPVFCLLAAILLLAPSAHAGSTCPGRNGPIAVMASGFHGHKIGILVEKRFREIRSSSRPGENPFSIFHPAFSCNHRQIAYTEGGPGRPLGSLIVLNVANGATKGVLGGRLNGGGFPTYLQSGWIVFNGSHGGERLKSGTFAVRPDGSRLHRLFWRKQQAASPDGEWFVTTDRHGLYHALYLLDRRGRIVRRLTPRIPEDLLKETHAQYLNPAFSPDGRWIAFQLRGTKATEVRCALFLVRRDGAHLRRLPDPQADRWGPGCPAHPTFSPDGRWLAYTRSAKAIPEGYVFALY